MKYRKVTESEKRKILLGMLKEIDEFCRLNGIRYSLAFGTALGAVRHHGFIPWDDDVDIIMPLPDMLFFKEIFRSEKLLYHDIDTNPEHAFHFSRVSYAPTFNKEGLIATSYGVNIDLYPVVGLPRSKDEFERFFLEACRYNKKKANIVKWRGRIVRRLPIKTIPGYTRMVRKERNFILFSYPYDLSSSFLHAGSLRMVNVIGFDVFACW